MTTDTSLIAKYLRRYGRPRAQLFLILVLTGAVGVLASIGLLHVGVRPMWLRYPIAAAAAYLFFLWVLRVWARRQLSRPEVVRELQGLRPGPEPAPGTSFSPPRFLDWLDFLSFVDDTSLSWILAGLLVAGVLVALVVAAAPVLLAEILLDALIVAGLWHRLRQAGANQTMSAAVRATRVPAALVLLGLAVLGAVFQWINPAADSIGDLF
jgi:hypothetical protein